MRLNYKGIITGYTVFLALFLGLQQQAQAQRQPVVVASPLAGDSIKAGKTLTVEDTVYTNLSLSSHIAQTKSLDNIVSLFINEFTGKVMPDTFGVTVRIRLNYVSATAGSGSFLDTLVIGYHKDHAYASRATRLYKDYYSLQTEIMGVDITGADSAIVKSFLTLENMLSIERFFTSDCSAVGSIASSDSAVLTDGELAVSWEAIPFTSTYDLEWTYIDSAALADHLYGDPSPDPALLFQNNATRVSINTDTFRIPLLYDGKGTLYFRVRGMQPAPDGEIIAGEWSTALEGGLGSYEFTGHQRNLNWQATTTYAEEGKHKSVVQYYDGSLKGRQTVTRDNTTRTTVVAETLYDKQGRPAIQVLPSPTLSTLIAYTPSFNVHDINSAEYDKSVYDTLLNADDFCASLPDSMSVANGAAQYYSPVNPLLLQSNSGYHQYIPDAKGYPFTETRYTRDNTGRIDRQGGVGPGFQIGSAHETKYFYGSADQKDLDALFGTEVGDASHYQKNMVRDANGQYSISYVDMLGRTIATALAGTAPATLQPLASANYIVETDELLSLSNNVIKDNGIQASKSILVPKRGNYDFHYSVSPESLSLNDCQDEEICYDCLYDLTITINDNCSNDQFGGHPLVITKRNFHLFKEDSVTHAIDTTCAIAAEIDTSFSVLLEEGSYDITKVLSVSREAMDYYRDSIYLPHNTCTSYAQFVLNQLDSIRQHIECTPDSAVTNLVTAYREQMMADLTPLSGQYADTLGGRRPFSIFTRFGMDYLYLYQDKTGYRDEEGNLDFVSHYNAETSEWEMLPPEKLSPEEFASNFKASWAETLLPLHPEYPLLVEYEKLTSAYNWESGFLNTDSYADAVAAGYLNPTGSTSSPASRFTVAGHIDSLFTVLDAIDPDAATSARISFNFALKNYLSKDNGASPVQFFNIWGLATAIVKCNSSDTTCFNHWNENNNSFNTDSLCPGDLDQAWRMFRSEYLRIREDWIDQYTRGKTGIYASQIKPPYYPVFPDRDITTGTEESQPDNYGNYNGTESDATTAANNLNEYLLNNCKAYVVKWWSDLAPCGYTSADSAVILPRLIQVAYEGADQNHPFGASTVKPGSTYAYRSFDEVIRTFNDSAYPAKDPLKCNAYLIPYPKPYASSALITNMPIITAPDSCSCHRINELYTEYLLDSSLYHSFSHYMQVAQGTTISAGDLDTLRSLCNSPSLTCRYLEHPILLPPAFQCGIGEACADCAAVKNVYDSFAHRFPGVVPMYDETDTVQQQKNNLFSVYMNNQLGFSKTAQEYLDFLALCDSSSYQYPAIPEDSVLTACDSLERLIEDYQRIYVKPISGYVDLDMRTFAGTKTLAAGPKGVFDVNRNLIGNTVSGTTQQINESFATIWNSNTDDQAVGTLAALSDGRFRLTLNPGQQAPCDGITGMRYYQFDGPIDTLDAAITGPGCYVDFGDGHKEALVKTDTMRGTIASKIYNPTRSFYHYYPTDSSLIDFYVRHFYPDSTLKTITIYHPDVQGYIGFNNIWGSFSSSWPSQINRLRHLRGYLPQETIYLIFHGLRDSSMNSMDSIWNFNEIHSIVDLDFSGGDDYTPIDNMNFPSFANNPIHNVSSTPYGPIPGPQKKIQPIQNWLPGLPTGFPGLISLRYTNFYGEGDVNVAIPSIRNMLIQGYFRSGQLDTIIMQATHSNVDSGSLELFSYLGNGRTSASDAAYAELISRNWYLLGAGMNHIPDVYDAITVPVRDSLPLTNAFTEYYNSLHHTSLGVHALENLYDSICGKPLDLCTLRPNLYPQRSCDSSHWTVYNPGSNLSVPAQTGADAYDNMPPTQQFFHDGVFNSPTFTQAAHYVLVNKKDVFSGGDSSWVLQWRVKPAHDFDVVNPVLRIGTQVTTLGAEWAQDPADHDWWISSTNLDPASSDFSGIGLQSNSHGLQADWVKIVNRTSGHVAYFEDFTATPGSCQAGPYLCGRLAMDSSIILNMSPCADTMNMAVSGATYYFDLYQQQLKSEFEKAYARKCLDVGRLESFTVTDTLREYHYTLYYYDQAGNLVKTIPPEGVQVQRRDSWFDSVATARVAGTRLSPVHGLPTTYRYNSLNQVVSQHSPDGGLSHFWYDRLGRLVVSQNAKQNPNSKFSYTLYDALGRITEVGQKEQATSMDDLIARDQGDLKTWLDATYDMGENTVVAEQVTSTVYDLRDPESGALEHANHFVNENFQKAYTLRNRVSYTRYYDQLSWNGSAREYDAFDNSSTYSYDIHGNVDTLLHNYRKLLGDGDHGNNQFKAMTYRYDLISGKVNEVHYQPGMADQFYHRYEYDAENRLTDVYTTDRSELLGVASQEEHDARYSYYKHGPLARTVLGQQQVQGIDYAYTLQGWLKGVNSDSLIDEDGLSGSLVAQDAYRFSLNYFNGDYAAISTGVNAAFPGHSGYLPHAGDYKPLYNGNISSMVVGIPQLGDTRLYNYGYDQLNRLVSMDAFNGYDAATHSWSGLQQLDAYKERVAYDGNGNILKYLRNGNAAQADMDSLNYNYYAGTNQLAQVRDQVVDGNYTEDIDNQASEHNYTYDAIGNLITDAQEHISNIDWSVYGKIREIDKSNGTPITYTYDVAGNRISKSFAGLTTLYVRDATGNVMSIYEAGPCLTCGGGSTQLGDLSQTELHLYGSSRLGILNRSVNMDGANNENHDNFERGHKFFELGNHLGNVLVTVSDKKFGHNAGNGLIDYYLADVVSASDYYPFGMLMPGRKWTSPAVAGSVGRYGFNGKENDNEISGEGSQYDYGFRIYNPRIGKFLSTDPLTRTYPWFTPYQFAGNMPINSIDLDGLENKEVIYWVNISAEGEAKLTGVTAIDYGPYSVGTKGRGVLITYMLDVRKNVISKTGKKLNLPDGSVPSYLETFVPEPAKSRKGLFQKINEWFEGLKGKDGGQAGGFVMTKPLEEGQHDAGGDPNAPSAGHAEVIDNADAFVSMVGGFGGGEKGLVKAIRSGKGAEKLASFFEALAGALEAGNKAGEAFNIAKEQLEKNERPSTSQPPNRLKPVERSTPPRQGPEWQYYIRKNGHFAESGRQSADLDSTVPGKDGAPDTIFRRPFLEPAVPTHDIPKPSIH